jgi:hypothetical protein
VALQAVSVPFKTKGDPEVYKLYVFIDPDMPTNIHREISQRLRLPMSSVRLVNA